MYNNLLLWRIIDWDGITDLWYLLLLFFFFEEKKCGLKSDFFPALLYSRDKDWSEEARHLNTNSRG